MRFTCLLACKISRLHLKEVLVGGAGTQCREQQDESGDAGAFGRGRGVLPRSGWRSGKAAENE